MAERIVVSLRISYAGIQPGRVPGYLERARSLTQRAEALGATLSAWSAVTLSFAFDAESIEEAIDLACSAASDEADHTDAWAVGVSQGDMVPLEPEGRADLAWGAPLVQAVALARIAAAGDVLVDATVEARRTGDLVTIGRRVARELTQTVRGERLDVRQPWKRDAATAVRRLAEAPFTGRAAFLGEVRQAKGGTLAMVLGPPGIGRSRFLAEILRSSGPSTVLVSPSGLGAGPLSALASACSPEVTLPPDLAAARSSLVAGEGIPYEDAVRIVTHLATRDGGAGTVLVDDVEEVDAATLSACIGAIQSSGGRLRLVVSALQREGLPQSLSTLPAGPVVALLPLSLEEGAGLAAGCTGGALGPKDALRWSRRGAGVPLAIIEAISCSLSTGELGWLGQEAFARRRTGGRGKPNDAAFWLARRAEELPAEARAVLTAIAMMGGTARRRTLEAAISLSGARLNVEERLGQLADSRWLALRGERAVLLSRTARGVILAVADEARVRSWHRAVAQAIVQSEGPLAHADAAVHASRAGDAQWSRDLAEQASLAGRAARIYGSPEPADTELVPESSSRPSRLSAFPRTVGTIAELSLRAASGSPASRCRASLALAVALAHAQRSDEALLQALEALARAREMKDKGGEQACVSLLARLFEGHERPEDGKRLRAKAGAGERR